MNRQGRFPWVFQMIANQAEGDRKLAVSDAFPDLSPEAGTAKVQEVQKWLKSLPFATRPLVKVSPCRLSLYLLICFAPASLETAKPLHSTSKPIRCTHQHSPHLQDTACAGDHDDFY